MSVEPEYANAEVARVVGELVTSIERALAYCDAAGANLPELLSAALSHVALLQGSYRLVEHRPGSWEAQHVAALDLSSLYREPDR